jgi:hypothetical protein
MQLMRKNLLAISIFCSASLAHANICTREYAPVCGQLLQHTQTFGNSCMMKGAGATWVSDGECLPAPPQSKTPAD